MDLQVVLDFNLVTDCNLQPRTAFEPHSLLRCLFTSNYFRYSTFFRFYKNPKSFLDQFFFIKKLFRRNFANKQTLSVLAKL